MSDGADRPSLSPEAARAEEVVDAAGRKIAGFVERLQVEVMRSVALAREEAEDIVAEARAMSQDQLR